VTTLAPGEVRLRFGDAAADWEFFSINGGYLQVHEDKVIVLADAAVPVSQIDAARARESADLIKGRLAELPAESDERDNLLRDLNWAEIQARVAEKRGS
jgi:F-type H+-transporting ATPase subunit epsilon